SPAMGIRQLTHVAQREVQGVTRSIEFPDNGPFSGSSKPAGCSESEPIRSLVIQSESPTLWTLGEGCYVCLNDNCRNRQTGFRGGRGDTQGQPYGGARETLQDAGVWQRGDIRRRNSLRS